MASLLKSGSVLSLLIVLAAYFYKRHADEAMQDRLNQVLRGLLRAEEKIPSPRTKIALGFGGCLDITVSALDILEKLGSKPPEKGEHCDVVNNQEDLEKLFAYFFAHGAAAERYVSNSTFFKHLVRLAHDQPDKRVMVGGNAPVMARRLAWEGADVLLGARMSKLILDTLPDSVKVAGEALAEDDVHLLMEYRTGDKWGQYSSPRANRLIVHNDRSNPFLESLEDFQAELRTYDADLLVVAGLQMMDNFPFEKNEKSERLQKLESLLANTPQKTKIHFEMASFTDTSLFKDIIDSTIRYADSLGMNEQELPNLVSILTKGNITLISDPYPRVATVLDNMRNVFKILNDTEEKDGMRKLTRLHLHTLAYQAIMTKKDASWKNSMSAAAKASLTANRHVCGSNEIDTLKAKLLMDGSFSTSQFDDAQRIPFHENRPIACWEEGEYDICVAPVLVCTEVLQTAGGGDNISSAGLVLQI